MGAIALITFWVLLAAALFQAFFACWFALVLLRKPRAPNVEVRWPKTAVLLSLRGADPQLPESLRRLLSQNYPDYELHVVVDSVNDPAWAVVQAAADGANGRLFLSPLTDRLTTCGLQCSAFVQAAKDLSRDIEVLVTVDGDLMPHGNWLRELVHPLLDDRVGASFGNRWFMPQQSNWGSLVRYLWNVAAVVPMYVFGIPWGGCFAMRRSAFEASQLIECWSQSIVHDTPVKARLAQLGYEVRFVPSLMMALRESCSLPFSRDFLKRQMTWTRLYHPHWSPIVLHATATSAIAVIAVVLVVWGSLSQNSSLLALTGWGMFAYLSTMVLLLGMLEFSVRQVLRRREERTGWMSWKTWLMLFPAIPLTQAIYFIAVMEATFRRQLVWRGVTYRLDGPHDITLVRDHPLETSSHTSRPEFSL